MDLHFSPGGLDPGDSRQYDVNVARDYQFQLRVVYPLLLILLWLLRKSMQILLAHLHQWKQQLTPFDDLNPYEFPILYLLYSNSI